MTSKKQVIKLKVCVIGEAKSGKSSFIQKIIGQNIIQQNSTSQYELTMFCAQAKNYFLEVQLWDCSSNHLSFHKYLRQAFFRNSSASLLVFDVNDPKWQDKAHNWIGQAYENQCYLVYAIGTKSDILDKEETKLYEAQKLKDSLLTKSNKQSWNQNREAQISQFFKKYDITVIFQSLKEDLKVQIKHLFVRMHDEYMIISRASLSRGLQIHMTQDFQKIQETLFMTQKQKQQK